MQGQVVAVAVTLFWSDNQWIIQYIQVHLGIAAGIECYHSHVIFKRGQKAIIVILSMVQFGSDRRSLVESIGLINS